MIFYRAYMSFMIIPEDAISIFHGGVSSLIGAISDGLSKRLPIIAP